MQIIIEKAPEIMRRAELIEEIRSTMCKQGVTFYDSKTKNPWIIEHLMKKESLTILLNILRKIRGSHHKGTLYIDLDEPWR